MVHNHIGCITNLDYALLVSVAHNIVKMIPKVSKTAYRSD